MLQTASTIAIFLVLLLASIALLTEFLRSGELPATMTGALAKLRDTLSKIFLKENLTGVEFSFELEEGLAEVRGEANVVIVPCDFADLLIGRTQLLVNSTIELVGFGGELRLEESYLNLSGRFKVLKFGSGSVNSSESLRLAACFRELESNWSKGYILLRGATGLLRVGTSEFKLKEEQLEVRNFFGRIGGADLTEISGDSELVRIGTKVTIS